MDAFIIILLIVTFILAFGIGANDETMAPVVGSHSLKLKTAVIAGGILSFFGCYFLARNVGKTIGRNLLGSTVEYSSLMMLSIILSTTIWLIVASKTGAPISTTHSVVGSIFGISLVWSITTTGTFLESMNWSKMGSVVLGWFISPLFGMFGAILLQLLMNKILKKTNTSLLKIEKTEKIFIYALVASVLWTQVSRGGNDAANAIGVFYGLLNTNDIVEPALPLLLAITGIMMALGLIFVGRNVIKSVGGGLVEMRPSDAFVISLSTTLVIFVCTILGLPISGSHVLVFAIIGSGFVKGNRPDKKSFRKMVLSWFLTFPVAALLCAVFYVILLGIF